MKITRPFATAVAAVTAALTLAACGAGSQTGTGATGTDCNFENPGSPTTVNVLAYNSSAIDPYTNAMVSGCSKDNLSVRHEPIDFAGQVQRTQTTLGGSEGTYDIIETYGFIIPGLAEKEQIQPLDDLYAKYADEYALDEISQDLRDRMSYDGKLWAVPMQAQAFTFVYRQDIFDELGLQVPTTFAEMKDAAETIQQKTDMSYPLALPLLSSGDLGTAYVAALGSLGKQYVDPDTRRPNFDTEESKQAIEEIKELLPYMDPQVLTFDQPRVQQQLFNDNAAMAIMFSGRMSDLLDSNQNRFSDKFAFAAPPAVEEGGPLYSQVSIDGWSIPHNTKVDPELLFNVIAASVSKEASEESLPAAYPAREGIVTKDNLPFGTAVEESIAGAPSAQLVPWAADMSNDTINVLAQIVSGQRDVDSGTQEMQRIAERIMERY